MKKDKFPTELYVTCDGDSDDGYYPIAYEGLPENHGNKIAVYRKVSEGKIRVTVEIVSSKEAK